MMHYTEGNCRLSCMIVVFDDAIILDTVDFNFDEPNFTQYELCLFYCPNLKKNKRTKKTGHLSKMVLCEGFNRRFIFQPFKGRFIDAKYRFYSDRNFSNRFAKKIEVR